MSQNQGQRFALGAVNLLAAISPGVASHGAYADSATMEAINSASLQSMESSWLSVSPICKARGFNADAGSVKSPQARTDVLNIYASFKA